MKTGAKIGRPRLTPEQVEERRRMLTFKARPKDLVVMEMLGEKKGLDRSNVIRLALYHLLEFEGLREKVEERMKQEELEKGNLPIQRAVSSAG